jgi:5-(carboxyamino)imidazole ribonucleotide synthase
MPSDSSSPTVGVVGAGQLARMMIEAATRLNIKIKVLASNENESAALISNNVFIGDYKNFEDLVKFSEDIDVLTFDHEHVPLAHLEKLTQNGLVIRPGVKALECAQNKAVMRQILTDNNLPIPQWKIVKNLQEISDFAQTYNWPVVFKTVTGGYDGKGVWILENIKEAEKIMNSATDENIKWLIEEKVNFVRELAVHVAKSPHGQSVVYSVVQSTQVNGVCDEVIVPAPNLSDQFASQIQEMALKIADLLNVTGVFSVELFDLGNGKVLINELAMRPHNSGHWTIDGSVTSQFENHLRAILDLPLGSPSLTSPHTVMVNVLGGNFLDMYKPFLHCMAHDPELRIHLYGKEVKLGRKVGHVNICGNNLPDLLERAHHAADYLSGKITE